MKHIPAQQEIQHVPVLLDQVIELLNPVKGESYLDLTAGYGGHAQAVAERAGYQNVTLVDRDQNALDTLTELKNNGATLIKDDFAHAATTLHTEKKQFDMLLVDLGVSSPQLDQANRGFSLKRDGPLDMRMDESQEKTAADIVNYSSTNDLSRILQRYGEESASRAQTIAKAIIRARPLHTTTQLAQVVLDTHRGGYQKIHPATRTFQAIRIALNEELQQIETLLPLIPGLLKPDGRVAIISFHSLEDRLVKRYFKEQTEAGYEATLDLLTKAIRGDTNDVHNPRARSATLRAAVKK